MGFCKSCCGCYSLVACEDHAIAYYTRNDLSSKVGHTVTISVDGTTDADHTFTVFSANLTTCRGQTMQAVAILSDVSSSPCICFKLTNCFDPGDIIYSRTLKLINWVGHTVFITGHDDPYQVEFGANNCSGETPVAVTVESAFPAACPTDCALWDITFMGCIGVTAGNGWATTHTTGPSPDFTRTYDQTVYAFNNCCLTCDCLGSFVIVGIVSCGYTGLEDPPPPAMASDPDDGCTKTAGSYVLSGAYCSYTL